VPKPKAKVSKANPVESLKNPKPEKRAEQSEPKEEVKLKPKSPRSDEDSVPNDDVQIRQVPKQGRYIYSYRNPRRVKTAYCIDSGRPNILKVKSVKNETGAELLKGSNVVTLAGQQSVQITLDFASKRAPVEVHLYITEVLDDAISNQSTDDVVSRLIKFTLV